jgi:hypothetical protein
VPLAATLDTLIEAGCPGDRYLLYPVDGEGRVISGVVAVTEVPESSEVDDGATQATTSDKGVLVAVVAQQLATIKEQSQALCRALEATTSGYGRVRPMEPPQQVVVEAQAAPQSGGMFKPEQIAEIASIAKSIFEMFKGGGGPAPTGAGP